MREKFLRALICTTTVLAIIWLTMMVRHISDNTNIGDISTTETETTEESHIVVSKPMEDITEYSAATPQEDTEDETSTDNAIEQEEYDVSGNTSVSVQTEPTEPVEASENTEEHATESPSEPAMKSNEEFYSASEFKFLGVIRWDGWRWTWYSEKVLPGGGLMIPGRHNDDNGYVCDENDYICLSSSTLNKGTVIDTPFGKQGKVYDTGCATDVIDVYVGW